MRLFSTAIMGSSNTHGGGHLHARRHSQVVGGSNNAAVFTGGSGGDVIETVAAVRPVSSPGLKADASSGQATLMNSANVNDGPSAGKLGDAGGSNVTFGAKAWKDILARCG
ncbi:hypothetical protein Vretifemale_11366 [Volvox reticuliferus]|nr:hypothetical protein Vretifemale_11366 [Volvox reticuliferus]